MNSQIKAFFPQVTKIEDAKHPLNVEVTSADVRSSKRMKHVECAMAVACKRKFKADGMIIGRQTAYLIKGTTAVRFTMPESVRKEIVSFDRGAGFEPGEYQLSKPRPSGPSGEHKNVAPKRKLNRVHMTANIRAGIGVSA